MVKEPSVRPPQQLLSIFLAVFQPYILLMLHVLAGAFCMLFSENIVAGSAFFGRIKKTIFTIKTEG